LKTRALRLEKFGASFVQKRRSHLATGAVMNTDKQDFSFCHPFSFGLMLEQIDEAARSSSCAISTAYSNLA
jgi:hypothetical protein